METINKFADRNSNLWSKVLGANVKDNTLFFTILRTHIGRNTIHDTPLQAIWHGPDFLNEQQGSYDIKRITDSSGNLLPYRYEDADSETIKEIIKKYNTIK